MKAIEIVKLVVSIIACQLAGLIGSIFTTPSIPTWYASLRKPVFTPPNWLFAPVWTALFLLMGVALFLIWRKGLGIPGVKVALIIFIVQLIFNILWSVAFFGLKSPLFGLIVIVILWIAILLTIINFYRLSTVAGLLLIPYIVWVSFAGILNFSLFTLNR
jgi:tryptophan-rich sensory protein